MKKNKPLKEIVCQWCTATSCFGCPYHRTDRKYNNAPLMKCEA